MNEPAVSETNAARQATFLVNHGDDLLQWSKGKIEIESYYEKQFRAIGGQMNLIIACFEDNGNMNDATEEYLRLSHSEQQNTADLNSK